MNKKYWAHKVGQSLNGQVKVLQVAENSYDLVLLLTDRVLGSTETLDHALNAANEHEVNLGLSARRSVY